MIRTLRRAAYSSNAGRSFVQLASTDWRRGCATACRGYLTTATGTTTTRFASSSVIASVQRRASSVNAHVSCATDGRKLSVKWRPKARTRACVDGLDGNYDTKAKGKELEDEEQDEETSTFHAVWLRHNCQCCECVQHSSGQKLVAWGELGGDLRISEISVRGHSLGVTWVASQNHGGTHVHGVHTVTRTHRGHLDLNWLRENSYSPGTRAKRKKLSRPLFADSLPVLNYDETVQSEEGIWNWLRCMMDYGLCLLRGVPTTPGEIKKVAEEIGPVQKTVHPEVFDILGTEDARPLTIAYSSLPICLHMDETVYESPPGIQLLHCIRYDECVEGGESILLDSLPLLEQLREDCPKHFATLTRVPATFQNTAYSQRGGAVAPLPDLRYQCPHISTDITGRVTGFMWNPLLEGPLCVPEEDVEPYFEAYNYLGSMMDNSPLKITHQLKPGEALTFNNRRVLHERNPFRLNGGTRHLQGVYVNIDIFKWKFQVLTSRLHPGYPVRHVLNRCNW